MTIIPDPDHLVARDYLLFALRMVFSIECACFVLDLVGHRDAVGRAQTFARRNGRVTSGLGDDRPYDRSCAELTAGDREEKASAGPVVASGDRVHDHYTQRDISGTLVLASWHDLQRSGITLYHLAFSGVVCHMPDLGIDTRRVEAPRVSGSSRRQVGVACQIEECGDNAATGARSRWSLLTPEQPVSETYRH